jgi:uncharacterized membrane protein
VRHAPPARRYHDRDGRLCLIAEPITFAELSGAGFDSLRHYGRSSADVLLALVEAVRQVALSTDDPVVHGILAGHLERFREATGAGDLIEHDRDRVHRYCGEVSAVLAANARDSTA